MPEPALGLYRVRVINRFDTGNSVVAEDLPHLHQLTFTVVAMQPGNPGNSALGSFTLPLFPPGSEQFLAAKPFYDALDYGQRIEAYSGGKLVYAGIITRIRKSFGPNSVYELEGHSDIALLNLARTFPGEVAGTTSVATDTFAKSHFGTNEIGWTDTFSPFTAANYTSTVLPGGATSGTWSGTTDNGLNVVTVTTAGTNSVVLISKSGAAAGDTLHSQYVEISGRLKTTSTDVNNAGAMGVGFSQSSANCNDSFSVSVQAHKNGSNFDLEVDYGKFVASVLTITRQIVTVLSTVQDASGSYISLTIGILASINAVQITINGKSVFGWTTIPTFDPGTGTWYPFILFGPPATGAATPYMTNLIQMTRYTADLNPTTSAFKAGTVGTSTQLMSAGITSGPTFLENITRAVTREGWMWRYTPVPYVVGTRTLGTIDMTTDPGTDRGTNQSVVFSRDLGNLVSLELSANADSFAAGTSMSGIPGTDGGGIAVSRDIPSLLKYGVLEDQTLAVTSATFAEQQMASRQVTANKIKLGSAGSKKAVVLRDPQTADVWRELDKVMIHDPVMGTNYLVARVIAYTLDEGQATQTLTLDQFSTNDLTLPQRRLQTSVWQMAQKFNTR